MSKNKLEDYDCIRLINQPNDKAISNENRNTNDNNLCKSELYHQHKNK